MKKDRESVKKGLSVFLGAVVLFFLSLFISGCFGERVSEQQHPDNPALAPGVSFKDTSSSARRLLERRAIVDRTGTILCISKKDPEKGVLRLRPYRGLLDDVLGYVDRYGRGLEGLEYVYDSFLLSRGKERGTPEPLILSVDKNLQALCKQNLKWQIRRLKARAGTVLLMDVRTGQILAMASLKRDARKGKADSGQENLAIKGLVNPWPVMVALAEARKLDERAKERQALEKSGKHVGQEAAGKDTANHEEPLIQVKRWHWHRFGDHAGLWTRLDDEELEGLALGPDLLTSLITVGLGQETGIDLPGEVQGRLPSMLSANVTDVISSRASSTPIQLLTAYTALLRNANPPRPRLAMNGGNNSGEEGGDIHRLVHEKAHGLFLSLAGDDSGPSIASYSQGSCRGQKCYQVIGLGSWPADNPKISYISVLFDTKFTPAQRRGTLGKMASLARRGAIALTEQYRFAGSMKASVDNRFKAAAKTEAHLKIMPDLRGLSVRSALELAGRLGMRIRISGTGMVKNQYPKPGTRVSGKRECVLICGKGPA